MVTFIVLIELTIGWGEKSMINALIAILVTAGAWVFFYYLIEYSIGWGKKGNDTPPKFPQTNEKRPVAPPRNH